MKKLISILATFSLTVTGGLSTYSVVSCTSKPDTDIKVDTYDTIQIAAKSTATFAILNYEDLSKVKITSDDNNDSVSVEIKNGIVFLTGKKYTPKPITFTINAKNALNPVQVKAIVNPILPNYIDQLTFVCNAMSGLLNYFDTIGDSGFATMIGTQIPVFGLLGSVLSNLVSKISTNPDKVDAAVNLASQALDLSSYASMTSQEALDASGIRIANAFGVLSGSYSLTDTSKAPVDWAKTHDKDALKSSMNVYSSSIGSIIDLFKSKVNWDDKDSIINNLKKVIDAAMKNVTVEQSIYAVCQIAGSVNLLLSYINMFDISKPDGKSGPTFVDYAAIKTIRTGKIDVSTPVDIQKVFNSIAAIIQSPIALRSLIGLLFSVSADKDTGNDVFFKKGLFSNSGLAYDKDGNYKLYDDTYGISPLVGNTVVGVMKSSIGKDIVKKINSLLPSEISIIITIDVNMVSSLAANAPILLLTYLANGINSDGVYLVDATILKFSITGKDSILNKLYDEKTGKPIIDIPFTKEQLETILKDPLGFIYKNVIKVNNDSTLKSLEPLFKITDQDLINVFGPKGPSIKVGDIAKAISTNLAGVSVSFNDLSKVVSSLLTPVKTEDGKSVSLINYMISHQSELMSPTSTLWKSLGLVANGDKFSITAGSPLSSLYTLLSNKNLTNFISSIAKVANAVNELCK